MGLSAPLVSVDALRDLHRLLLTCGFWRYSSCDFPFEATAERQDQLAIEEPQACVVPAAVARDWHGIREDSALRPDECRDGERRDPAGGWWDINDPGIETRHGELEFLSGEATARIGVSARSGLPRNRQPEGCRAVSRLRRR